MNVSVIIPAYNEEKMIGQVVKGVLAFYPHVFVVDDGSSDATSDVARNAGATVLKHALNRGQGAALATGIEAALISGADIIVTFDADGQMDPADIAAMIEPLKAGECDVTLGSRFLNNHVPRTMDNGRMPAARRWTLKAALVFTRITTGLKLTDTHNGLRAFTRKAAAMLELRCDRMAHASEILEEISRLDLRYREVPVNIIYTDYSMKKGQKLSGAFRIMRDLIISSWSK
jgi:polyprenyl-phospho-N-acetylgalactosaminyl synthase